MKWPNLAGLALMAGLGAACAHTQGMAANQADDDDASAELREHHRHHYRGGVTQFIAMSLDTIGEDDAQRPAIEKLQGEMFACLAPTRELEAKLMLNFADGVAGGTMASASLDQSIQQLSITSATVYDCSINAMNQLHGLLTPAEREVVADKVQDHWEIWRQVNDEAEAGNRSQGSRVADLAEELSLTTDQVEKISAALTASSPGRKFEAKKAEAQVLAFTAAFTFEKFDARTVTPDANGRFASHGAERMARFYETVTPLLTQAQRLQLAELLRDHANHPPTLSAN